MESQNNRLEWRVGAISIAALVLLVAGILWGKGLTDSIDRAAVTFEFDDASGITTSTPVFLHGVPVGTVTSLSTSEQGAIVKARVDGHITLRDDARAVVRVKELTGGTKIELDPGMSGRPLGNNPITGKNEGDIGALIAVVANLAGDIGPLMRRADSLLVELYSLVSDPELQRGVRNTVAGFAEVGERANRLLATNGPRITSAVSSIDQLSKRLNLFVSRNELGIESIISKTNTLTTDAGVAVGEARQTLGKINKLVDRLNGITEELSSGEGLISTLINDPEFTRELEQTIRSLRALLVNIDRRGVNVNVELGHEND